MEDIDANLKQRRRLFVGISIACLIVTIVAYGFALPDIEDPDRIDSTLAAISGLFGLASVVALMKALRLPEQSAQSTKPTRPQR